MYRVCCCEGRSPAENLSEAGENTVWQLQRNAKLDCSNDVDVRLSQEMRRNGATRAAELVWAGRGCWVRTKSGCRDVATLGTAEAITGNGQSLGNGRRLGILGRSDVDDGQVLVMDLLMGRSDGDGDGWKSMGRGVIARS